MPMPAPSSAQIILGDAYRTLRESVPDDAFAAVITDPPYCSGGSSSTERTSRSSRAKYVSSDARHSLPSFDGDERDQRSFMAWSTLWLGEAHRATRPGGLLMVFSDWRQLPVMSDAVQAAGWRWRGIALWCKRGARPGPGFARDAEFVVWASHGAWGARRPPCLPGTFVHSIPRGAARLHIAAKPIGLMHDLVCAVEPGGPILDPFAGSGPVGVAAVESGRPYLGIECHAQYAAIAQDRLDAARGALADGQTTTQSVPSDSPVPRTARPGRKRR